MMKIITSGILLVLIIVAGVILHKSGKPYPVILFGIHKIFTVAMIVIMAVVMVQFFKDSEPLNSLYISLGLVVIALLALFVSGAMMSLDRMQEGMLLLHRIATGLILVSFPIVLYTISVVKQ